MSPPLIDEYLEECRELVLDEIRHVVPTRSRYGPALYDLMLDYPLRSAKGLRPAVCIATCRALGGTLEGVLKSAATLELYHKGEARLLDLLAQMTCKPADLLGLPQGRLAKGAPADLVLFDLDAPGRIDADRLRSKSKNSPFDGRPIQGRVLRTIVDGRTVFEADA